MFKRIVVPDRALVATAWYALLACVMTWPLAAHLCTSVPKNLGDPLLNTWILGWDASHMAKFAGGHWNALAGFWNANIFYPEPLTLAYSEHLIAQAVQILPVYAITGNLVLCYNLLFLSTFVLSGLGAFLLVRDLTGNGRAAFVAGLLYGFALVRAQHLGHLQVLSSQWMPFVLFGVRRYFATRRWTALGGAAAALVAQNLSCGYYLIFFQPFLVAYVLYEMWAHRALSDRRAWLSVAVAGVAVAAFTVPFWLPYLDLPAHGLGRRPHGDVANLGADVYSYLTAYPGLRLWGPLLQTFPKIEGCLFAGIVPWALAMTGVVAVIVGRRAPGRPMATACFFAVTTGAAIWLSFGPVVRMAGHAITGPTIYDWLYWHLPGFGGLRVPSRYAMLSALFVSVLAGFGADAVNRRRKIGDAALFAIAVLFLAESAFVPLPLARVWTDRNSTGAPLGLTADQVYRYVRLLPASVVLIEFPINDEQLSDNLYMYASTAHWRRLVNGRSGWYPTWYARMARTLEGAPGDPEAAWRALRKSGATHVIVHEELYSGAAGASMTQWLRNGPTRELFAAGPDHLFELHTKCGTP